MVFSSIIIFILIGCIAGFLGGLLGIGGGLVVVPGLMLYFTLYGFRENTMMHVAVGTSLAAMVFTAGASAFTHYKANSVHWKFYYALAPGIIIGSILGSLFADLLPSRDLAFIFGVSIFCIGLSYMLPSKKQPESTPQPQVTPHVLLIGALGVGIGALSTILGIGGGVLTVPLLSFFRVPLRNAIATSAVTGFLIAFFGAVSFLYFGLGKSSYHDSVGYIYLPAFICIGLVSCLGAYFGAKCTYIFPVQLLRRIFGGFAIFVGIYILYAQL